MMAREDNLLDGLKKEIIIGLKKEIIRCMELRMAYIEMGPNGLFGELATENALKEAEDALASGDIVDMTTSLKRLVECE